MAFADSAPGDNDNGSDEGRVYVWFNGAYGTDEGFNTLLDVNHDSTIDEPAGTNSVYFGSALAKAIYNNGSFQDLFIGASADDTPGIDAGSVYLKLYK